MGNKINKVVLNYILWYKINVHIHADVNKSLNKSLNSGEQINILYRKIHLIMCNSHPILSVWDSESGFILKSVKRFRVGWGRKRNFAVENLENITLSS